MDVFAFSSPAPFDVDQSLLSSVTESVQSQERLELELRRKFPSLEKEKLLDGEKLKTDTRDVLNTLKHIKSRIEGSHFDFEPTSLNSHGNDLRDLKQLTTIPGKLNDAKKESFSKLIHNLFEGRCKRLLSGVLLSCPWYRAAQAERHEPDKHSVVFIVFIAHDNQFLSPSSQHLTEQSDVIDLGWLCAVELYHFAHCLSRGKSRFTEALHSRPDAVLFAQDDWWTLRDQLSPGTLMGQRGFVEQCRGQAVGGVAKKQKSGKMGIRDVATVRDFCESFRLLHNLHNLSRGEGPCNNDLDIENLPPIGQRCLEKLKLFFTDPKVSKHDLFDLILEWKDDLSQNVIKSFKYTSNEEVQSILGKWLTQVRVRGQTLAHPTEVCGDDHSKRVSLMEKIGGPLTTMSPGQVVMVAQAGSYMYGLATPDSDADFVVVYREHTQRVLSTCKRLTEIHECRGPQKAFEYGMYEVRTFSEMLLKGSVVVLELLFVEDLDYTSPEWKALAAHREKFVTEWAVQQYLGLVKNNLFFIQSERHRGTPRERKLFYQIFHKMWCLETMIEGHAPAVRCHGETRDFIMGVRTAPLEGEFSRENLLTLAQKKYEDFRDKLANRKTRLAEFGDYRLVTNWLMAVRGFS